MLHHLRILSAVHFQRFRFFCLLEFIRARRLVPQHRFLPRQQCIPRDLQLLYLCATSFLEIQFDRQFRLCHLSFSVHIN